jgi:hypothetical protein
MNLIPWSRVRGDRNTGFVTPAVHGITVPADSRKLGLLSTQAVRGLRNFMLFQRFPSFGWPFWIPRQHPGGEAAVSSPVILNRSARDWICFSNQFSPEVLRIDPSGMISAVDESWSLEFWWLQGDTLIRAQNREGNVIRTRDTRTSVISIRWKSGSLEMSQSFFGSRGTADEIIIRSEVQNLRSAGDSCFFIVLRPYSNEAIGGLESIEYRKDAKSLRINGIDRFMTDTRPDLVLAGNGSAGDINHSTSDRGATKIHCDQGMATMALGFRVKKGARIINLRIGLSETRQISSARFNHDQVAREYVEFSSKKLSSGAQLTLPGTAYTEMFAACKAAVVHQYARVLAASARGSSPDVAAQAYHVCSALSRSGFHGEAVKIATHYLKKFVYPEQRALGDHIAAAFTVSMYADYFLFSRDDDSLREVYPAIKRLSDSITEFSRSFRSIDSASRVNFIDGFDMEVAHAHDFSVLMGALRHGSYLARCMGIFGDESKYASEVSRLKDILLKWCASALAGGESIMPAEFAAYCVTTAWPHGLNVLVPDDTRSLAALVADSLRGLPVYNPSYGGWDSYISLVLATNLLLAGDLRCYTILDKVCPVPGEAVTFTDFRHPLTGRGVHGEGESPKVIWAMGAFLRSMLFMDYEHRLEILPLPRVEWFEAGNEMAIQSAPSRFGEINIRILCLPHEVQYHFTGLPKFVPPEIVINLPFKTKIKTESDFILKKEVGNSYIINGWPSVVRFIR